MEARAEFKKIRISKTFVAAVLIVIAIGFGVMGGYLAAKFGGSAAASSSQSVHAAPGTVLRQDATDSKVQGPAAGTVLRQDEPSIKFVPVTVNGDQPRRAPSHRELW